MTKTAHLFAAITAVLSLGAASFAQSADLRAGAAKAKEVCVACHGLDGNSPSPDFPKLGGQHSDYLAHSLQSYKDGRRRNAIMAGFAAALTKQDIENLAAYYASQPAVVFVEPYTYKTP